MSITQPAPPPQTSIDVIVPTYNSSTTISSCLSSIHLASLSAPHIYVRILIADGGSLDDTQRIVAQYASIMTIIVVSLSDTSPEDGINKAFSAASADLIMIIGSDDMVSASYFAYMPQADCIAPNTLYWPNSNYIYMRTSRDVLSLSKVSRIRPLFTLRYVNPSNGFGWIARRDSLALLSESNNGRLFSTDFKYVTDSDFFLRARNARWSYSLSTHMDVYYLYCIGGRSHQNQSAAISESSNLHSAYAGILNVDVRLFWCLYKRFARVKSFLRTFFL